MIESLNNNDLKATHEQNSQKYAIRIAITVHYIVNKVFSSKFKYEPLHIYIFLIWFGYVNKNISDVLQNLRGGTSDTHFFFSGFRNVINRPINR